MTISCQPDGRLPQPVRPWKSGRVHLAECSKVVVFELPYSTEFGRENRKFASEVQKMENLMTVVDRLDELQASSVGRRKCQHAAANGSQTHGRPCRHIESALPTGDGLWPLPRRM